MILRMPNITMNIMIKPKSGTSDSCLLVMGKSSRLQEMRNKSLNQTAPAKALKQPQIKPQSSELSIAQQIIDQHLDAILAGLPGGKQRSLFKIRYGIELEQIKQLPIRQIIRLLKIEDPQLAQARGEMKRVLELTYNGQPPQ
jgi:hypothetical protein